QFIFVSIDPKRDTSEKLSAYVNYFSPDFLGFTGTEQQISAFTKSMGVPVMMQFTQDGAYTLDHSASLFVINPQLQLTAIFSPPYQATALASDLRLLATH
ncbi:MAG: SCO family protein, partial [Steroidobacter sp.]